MQEYLNPLTIANNVRMHRTQFAGSYLIVEGSKDGRLYANHIDLSACHIVIARNKQNAIGTLEILNEAGFAGVLAIADSDFDNLERKTYSSSDLILTDHHDLECMLFYSPAFGKVLSEFGSEEKVKKFESQCGTDLRAVIVNAGCVLGALRLVSLRNNLGLDFKGLVFSNFVTAETLAVDLPRLVRAVKNNSKKHLLDVDELREHVEELLRIGHDPLQVCVGHDLVHIFALALRKVIGSNNAIDVRAEVLEKILRLSYEQGFFRSTNLHSAICQWERNNPHFKVLLPSSC
jgi:hypothetical protein